MNPFIVIENEREWRKGLFEGLIIDSMGVKLEGKSGFYIGEIVDTLENEHLWSKIKINLIPKGETKLIFYTLALDNLLVTQGKEIYDLKEVLNENSFIPTKVLNLLMGLSPNRHESATDILLYPEKGRYLIYWFELVSEGESDVIKSIEIHYEKFSWLNYLPQVYTEDSDFLERYLAIFQTVFDEFESIVDEMPLVYDPLKTEGHFLETLNKWLPVDSFMHYNETQKRMLLNDYHEINRLRGTKEGLIKLIKFFTGQTPFIVEHMDYKYLMESAVHRALYKKLYVDQPFGFTILIHAETVKDKKQYQALYQIISQYIPAQVVFKIAQLNHYMILDDYAYLGINSNLHSQVEIKLDEQSMLSMGIISHD